MSINESKESESINQKTGERNFIAETECQCKDAHNRVKKAKAKKSAIVFMVVTILALAAAIGCIMALETIGWINTTFRIVLLCIAGCVAMFKTGYLWHEITN